MTNDFITLQIRVATRCDDIVVVVVIVVRNKMEIRQNELTRKPRRATQFKLNSKYIYPLFSSWADSSTMVATHTARNNLNKHSHPQSSLKCFVPFNGWILITFDVKLNCTYIVCTNTQKNKPMAGERYLNCLCDVCSFGWAHMWEYTWHPGKKGKKKRISTNCCPQEYLKTEKQINFPSFRNHNVYG